jgi:hypothetical protein
MACSLFIYSQCPYTTAFVILPLPRRDSSPGLSDLSTFIIHVLYVRMWEMTFVFVDGFGSRARSTGFGPNCGFLEHNLKHKGKIAIISVGHRALEVRYKISIIFIFLLLSKQYGLGVLISVFTTQFARLIFVFFFNLLKCYIRYTCYDGKVIEKGVVECTVTLTYRKR